MVPKSIMLAHILTVVSLMPKTYRIDNATTEQMAKLIRVIILRLKIVLEICRNFFIVVLLIGELWAVAQPQRLKRTIIHVSCQCVAQAV